MDKREFEHEQYRARMLELYKAHEREIELERAKDLAELEQIKAKEASKAVKPVFKTLRQIRREEKAALKAQLKAAGRW